LINGIKIERKMSSREAILAKIKANKPETLPLPTINYDLFEDGKNLLEEFKKKVEVVGGNVLEVDSVQEALEKVTTLMPDTKVNFTTIAEIESFNSLSLASLKTPHELEDLDVLILRSDLAVAENGAVWLSDAELPIRVLPFITKHLVIMVNKENIVSFMHYAYQKLEGASADYGVFLSGPSKTADIEQSLVIGAHGALSLTIFVI
jgi:L-lactate dehydrogenase complex protein LldG